MKSLAIAITAAAVSSVGIAANASSNADLNAPTTAPSSIHAVSSRNGKFASNLDLADSDIRVAFCHVTLDALSAKDMDRLVGTFNASARTRIMKSSDYNGNYGASVDRVIDEISSKWKAKYGNSFDIERMGEALGASFASIQTAAPGQDSELISRITKATGESAAAHPMLDSRPIALAKVKAAGGLPTLNVALICEKGGNWAILVPDSLTADGLRQNLLHELSAVNDHSAKWPANESAAYRQVAHRVLMAVLDKPMAISNQASAKPMPVALNNNEAVTKAQPTATPAPLSQTSSYKWWQFWHW